MWRLAGYNLSKFDENSKPADEGSWMKHIVSYRNYMKGHCNQMLKSSDEKILKAGKKTHTVGKRRKYISKPNMFKQHL